MSRYFDDLLETDKNAKDRTEFDRMNKNDVNFIEYADIIVENKENGI
jgi:hypothetical protein